MLLHTLDERYIEDIGHAFGYYDYEEEAGLVSVFSGPDAADLYIRGYARGMLRGGFLHTTSENYEGFIAYKLPGEKIGLQTMGPLLKGVFQSMRFGELVRFAKAAKGGGPGLRDRMGKERKPYIFVGMVCVREAFQHRGFMRKLMALAYQESDRLQVPVILETDAVSKLEKYQHLGMELAGTRDFGENGKLFDLIRYPEANVEA